VLTNVRVLFDDDGTVCVVDDCRRPRFTVTSQHYNTSYNYIYKYVNNVKNNNNEM